MYVIQTLGYYVWVCAGFLSFQLYFLFMPCNVIAVSLYKTHTGDRGLRYGLIMIKIRINNILFNNPPDEASSLCRTRNCGFLLYLEFYIFIVFCSPV